MMITTSVRKCFNRWFFSDWKPLQVDGCLELFAIVTSYSGEKIYLMAKRGLQKDTAKIDAWIRHFQKLMVEALELEIARAIEGEAKTDPIGIFDI